MEVKEPNAVVAGAMQAIMDLLMSAKIINPLNIEALQAGGNVFVVGTIENHYELTNCKKAVVRQLYVTSKDAKKLALHFNGPVGNAIAHTDQVSDEEMEVEV